MSPAGGGAGTAGVDTANGKKPLAVGRLPLTLSPSAINTCLACSLRFYFRYVARLKPCDEMTEDIDGRLLGNVLHHAMERLYKPFVTETLSAAGINAIAAQAPLLTEAVNAALANEYYHAESLPADAFDDGKMMLLHDVVLKYIRQILRYDAAQAPFTIAGTEQRIERQLDIPPHPCIGGIIDRLDRKGDTWHIIDYKTGAVKNKFKGVEALFSSDPDLQNPAILQVLLYSVLLKQQKPNMKISPKLYFMREIYNPDADFHLIDTETKQTVTDIDPYVEPFTNALHNTLAQLFDAAVPFEQTAYPNACTYCDYRKICGKQ
jgi:RecB family exonuclease